jgi:hypothetical protein
MPAVLGGDSGGAPRQRAGAEAAGKGLPRIKRFGRSRGSTPKSSSARKRGPRRQLGPRLRGNGGENGGLAGN